MTARNSIRFLVAATLLSFTPSIALAKSHKPVKPEEPAPIIKPLAFVSNQAGDVSVIDLDTLEVIKSINTLSKGSRGIGITDNGKYLVTANKDEGNISIIDKERGKTLRQVNIGKNPEFVRIQGNLAFVTFEPSAKSGPPSAVKAQSKQAKNDEGEPVVPGHIAVVNLKRARVILDIVGKPETEGIEFSPDKKKILVTNESDNSISVHSIKTGKRLKSINLAKYGERPRGIKVSPNGNYIVTTLELSDKFLVLDTDYKVIKEVSTGEAPYGISFNKAGDKLYVASSKSKAIQVFNTNNFEKEQEFRTGDRCWHFTFTPDESKILAACGKSSEVVVLDTNTGEVISRIPDQGTPWGIVTYPKSMGSLDKP